MDDAVDTAAFIKATGQWGVVSGEWSVEGMRALVDDAVDTAAFIKATGQWAVVSGQWGVVSRGDEGPGGRRSGHSRLHQGHWSVGSGQWSVGSGQ